MLYWDVMNGVRQLHHILCTSIHPFIYCVLTSIHSYIVYFHPFIYCVLHPSIHILCTSSIHSYIVYFHPSIHSYIVYFIHPFIYCVLPSIHPFIYCVLLSIHPFIYCVLPSIHSLVFIHSCIYPFTNYPSIFLRYLAELGLVIHMLMVSYVMQCLLILYFQLHLLTMWKMSVFSMKHLIVN